MNDILIFRSPEELPSFWDNYTESKLQQRDFLCHLHKTNPCQQQYMLFKQKQNELGFAVIYRLHLNLLTFLNRGLNVPIWICGLPLSVSVSGLWGSSQAKANLLKRIKEMNRGFLLVLNQKFPIENKSWHWGSTLPNMKLKIEWENMEEYCAMLRHSYRRRYRKIAKIANPLIWKRQDFTAFKDKHYKLYLDVFHHSQEKLECLKKDFFQGLKEPFELFSCYYTGQLLAWFIGLREAQTYHFIFIGMDYSHMKKWELYNHCLFQILTRAISCKKEILSFGQTTELSKSRVGSNPEELFMAGRHSNPLLHKVMGLFKKSICYTMPSCNSNVFRTSL